jgi:E3 ubiquitin-protein ligase DOA10
MEKVRTANNHVCGFLTRNKKPATERNSRSLHYAPPDFQLRVVASVNFMWHSLRRAAHVAVGECRVVGDPGTLRSR